MQNTWSETKLWLAQQSTACWPANDVIQYLTWCQIDCCCSVVDPEQPTFKHSSGFVIKHRKVAHEVVGKPDCKYLTFLSHFQASLRRNPASIFVLFGAPKQRFIVVMLDSCRLGLNHQSCWRFFVKLWKTNPDPLCSYVQEEWVFEQPPPPPKVGKKFCPCQFHDFWDFKTPTAE